MLTSTIHTVNTRVAKVRKHKTLAWMLLYSWSENRSVLFGLYTRNSVTAVLNSYFSSIAYNDFAAPGHHQDHKTSTLA